MLCGKKDANKINIDHCWYGLFRFRQEGAEVSVSFEGAQNKRFASSGDAIWLSQALDSAVTFSAEAKNTSSDNMWVTASTSKGEENGNAVVGKAVGGRAACHTHKVSFAPARSEPWAAAPVANSHYCCFVFSFFCHKQDLVSFPKKKSPQSGGDKVKESCRFFSAHLHRPEAWAILGLLSFSSFVAPRNYRRIFMYFMYLFIFNLDITQRSNSFRWWMAVSRTSTVHDVTGMEKKQKQKKWKWWSCKSAMRARHQTVIKDLILSHILSSASP